MPINWRNVMARKKVGRKAKVQDRCFSEGRTDYDENRHFEIALPEEALMMSRRGKAKGFDISDYCESYGRDTSPIVEISKKGVQLLVVTAREKEWLEEVAADAERLSARKALILKWNWTSWDDLSPINREFLHSLLWIPVDPCNEMEILARASL